MVKAKNIRGNILSILMFQNNMNNIQTVNISFRVIGLFFLFIFFSKCTPSESKLKSGDLLFQINESNDFTKAITTTTGEHKEFSYSHVGIVNCNGDQVKVIEALPETGVHEITLQEFLNSSAHDKNGKPLVVVMRIIEPYAENEVIPNAEKFIGEPYDQVFSTDDSAIYCSELVYKSYFKTDGKALFTANPMSFKDSTGKISKLWVDYFGKQGKPVPEGEPGTNPNDISKEKCLKEVYKYF